MSRDAKFWNRLAARYARTPIADEAAYQRKLEVTRAQLRPEMTLLEFGCGTGSTALVHAPHVKHITAIDFSEKMLEIARHKAVEQGVANVSFERTSIEDLAAPDESFDVVLGLSILHLVADRAAVIAKVHRLLKPGGRFVSSTVCIGDKLGFFRYLAPLGRAVGLLPRLKVFTRQELLDSLTGAGFEIEETWLPGRRRIEAVFILARKTAA